MNVGRSSLGPGTSAVATATPSGGAAVNSYVFTHSQRTCYVIILLTPK